MTIDITTTWLWWMAAAIVLINAALALALPHTSPWRRAAIATTLELGVLCIAIAARGM